MKKKKVENKKTARLQNVKYWSLLRWALPTSSAATYQEKLAPNHVLSR